MKYFHNINTLEELRAAYRALLKKFHPDNGGSEEATKEINLEYEKLFQVLKNRSGADQKTKYDTQEDENLREVLQQIINLNVNIEICGSWKQEEIICKKDLETLKASLQWALSR